jgi:GTP cyclohydrolase I
MIEPAVANSSYFDVIEHAYRSILGDLNVNGDGVTDTPRRAASAMREMTSGYHVDVESLFRTFDAEDYDEMIVVRDIPFVSLCEHHMLTFSGRAAVGYIPVERIVGLSKLARVVDAYAKRLQVQERITTQVSDAVVKYLKPLGSIVVMEAEHSCMACRGVKKPGIKAVTSKLTGLVKEDAAARSEALTLMGIGRL